MKYQATKNISLTALKSLYDSVGWTSYTADMPSLKTALENSLDVIAAFDNQQLVGLIRVVGDGISIIYIQDLLIQPKYQNKGIGSQLVTLILEKYKNVRQKLLLTLDEPNTRSFYQKCGFTSCDQGSLVAFYREY